MNSGKGSLTAPFFFVALALACVGTRFASVTGWALSAVALMGTAWSGATTRAAPSWLSISVISFAGLVTLNAIFLTPAYNPAGLYNPLLLALAFVAFRRFGDSSELHATVAAFASGAVLAAWGLVQAGPLGMARAEGFFLTPAINAGMINLFLVPLLAAVMLGRREGLLLAVGVLFAAALFAADSRGGFLGLTIGLATAAILAMRAGLLQRRGVVAAFALLVAGFLLVLALQAIPWGPTAKELPADSVARAESSQSRLELYALSWNTWLERPLIGTGYLTFSYALERNRSKVPSYGESNETWFAHNDYLQTLQELGPAGLAAFLAVTGLPLLLAYRKVPSLPAERRPGAVAAAAGLASMAGHAMVDFPFFIPVCLVLYGALLGALDRQLAQERGIAPPASSAGPVFRAARAGALLLAALVLLRPLLAEWSSAWGLRKFAAGQGPSAALWLGLASSIEPADWRYHWYAGQFWDAQAADSGKREAARLAVAAYMGGVNANPLEPKSLLGLISMNLRYRDLLDAPADPRTLQEWMARAETLAPYRAEVREVRARLGAAK
jgi:O-antigen ligase